jgi:hypothetical protein
MPPSEDHSPLCDKGGVIRKIGTKCHATRPLPGSHGNDLKLVQMAVVLGIVRHQRH